MRKGQSYLQRARALIPGETQLLSKRSDRFLPGNEWPSYFDRSKGVEVFDLDGKKYIDMSINGIGACILGSSDPDVDAAVKNAIDRGIASTFNCPEEVDLSELLLELHPWAHMARFARTGGEAVAIAIRIARAASGKDHVAFCGYHGWHDWYLAANLDSPDALEGHLRAGLEPLGVPACLRGTAHPFHYNQIHELESTIARDGKNIGVIVMEPIRSEEPRDDFLKEVQRIAKRIGAVFIVDEISAGFRLTCGGAHLLYDIEPDIAVFAKAMSNGYPMAAIIGKKEVMSIAKKCFISSTNWTERTGPVAALATIEKHRKHNVHEHLIRTGASVQKGWRQAAEETGLSIKIDGIKPLGHFQIDTPESPLAHTLFTRLMLERGFLAGSKFYATYAHTNTHVDQYLAACREVFGIIALSLRTGSLKKECAGMASAQEDFIRYA